MYKPHRRATRRPPSCLTMLTARAAAVQPLAAGLCCAGCQLSAQPFLQGAQAGAAEGLRRLEGGKRTPAIIVRSVPFAGAWTVSLCTAGSS